MVYLRLPQHGTGKGFMLIWAGENIAEGEKFCATGFTHLSWDSHYFLQSNSDDFKAFEFWTQNQDLILAESMKIAEMMGYQLEIYDNDPPLHVLYPSQFNIA